MQALQDRGSYLCLEMWQLFDTAAHAVNKAPQHRINGGRLSGRGRVQKELPQPLMFPYKNSKTENDGMGVQSPKTKQGVPALLHSLLAQSSTGTSLHAAL